MQLLNDLLSDRSADPFSITPRQLEVLVPFVPDYSAISNHSLVL